jgi:tRNA(fMet)-specific endonuclease VapC
LRSLQTEKNLKRLNEFIMNMGILPCDQETATYYGLIKNQLRHQGKPIPENDIWLAATARQQHLCLISHDKHFTHIAGLSLSSY